MQLRVASLIMKAVYIFILASAVFPAFAPAQDEIIAWKASVQEIARRTLNAERIDLEIQRPEDFPSDIGFPPGNPLVTFTLKSNRRHVGSIGVASFPNPLLAAMYLRHQYNGLAQKGGAHIEKGKIGDESFSVINKKRPLADGRFSGDIAVRFGSIVLYVGTSDASYDDSVSAAQQILKVAEPVKKVLDKISNPQVQVDLPTGMQVHPPDKVLTKEEGKSVAREVTRITNFIFLLAQVIDEKPVQRLTKQQVLSALPKEHPFQFKWKDPFGEDLPSVFDLGHMDHWYSPTSYDIQKQYPEVD